jgi:hypothetical protein
MVASGVLPVGAMRPRLSASSVTSRVVRGRLADFRTASAAARKVISNDGNEGNDGPSPASQTQPARERRAPRDGPAAAAFFDPRRDHLRVGPGLAGQPGGLGQRIGSAGNHRQTQEPSDCCLVEQQVDGHPDQGVLRNPLALSPALAAARSASGIEFRDAAWPRGGNERPVKPSHRTLSP